ncbi:hypothetical protein H257_10429 [Aphanomyces astaci]|uniref:Uncharacterized protein n=1 Tax=Aphanomyces astaci TaxID=112090 RepID=W4G6D5_APHAT|nr:hypothetical protein H257_10429 [Aphanomyces astaci]ETV75235.1 hypothetical protein H257_10429 [Aphanomyces astaci]|eukprot:XP_009835283.1 hypothetical protein H257_10429 [Aphanomyces astaci]
MKRPTSMLARPLTSPYLGLSQGALSGYRVQGRKAAVSRAWALVLAYLSGTVRSDIAAANLEKCAHCIISKLRSEEQKYATAISVYQRFHSFQF